MLDELSLIYLPKSSFQESIIVHVELSLQVRLIKGQDKEEKKMREEATAQPSAVEKVHQLCYES